MLMSLTSLGTFNGVVKYGSEYKSDQKNLLKLFSTLYVFSLTASVVLFFILFFGASYFSNKLFLSDAYVVVFKVMAVAVPFISMNRIFSGVINGISDYKKHQSGTVAALMNESFDEMGYNYRMTNLQGAMGVAQMKKLNNIIA